MLVRALCRVFRLSRLEARLATRLDTSLSNSLRSPPGCAGLEAGKPTRATFELVPPLTTGSALSPKLAPGVGGREALAESSNGPFGDSALEILAGSTGEGPGTSRAGLPELDWEGIVAIVA
jgi:hypothetical protein